MPVTDIKEIRILPPLALGRFGSSAEPMHNYETVVTPGTGFRELRPAETLLLNPSTGDIVAKETPPAVRFKDGAGRVKPVCPFLEIWARFDDEAELRPLTLTELGDLQRGPRAHFLGRDVRQPQGPAPHRRSRRPRGSSRARHHHPRPPSAAGSLREFQGGPLHRPRLGAIRQADRRVPRDPAALHAACGPRLWAHCERRDTGAERDL